MRTLYHSTSDKAAKIIEREGFAESEIYPEVRGVFFSDRPLTHADGVARDASTCFCVQVPPGMDLSYYEVIEEGRPTEAYREWLIPAEIVNTWPRNVEEEASDWPAGNALLQSCATKGA